MAKPDGVLHADAVSSVAPLQESLDTEPAQATEGFSNVVSDSPSSSGQSDRENPHANPAPMDESEQAVPETTVTGTVLDRNTSCPVAGARVGF